MVEDDFAKYLDKFIAGISESTLQPHEQEKLIALIEQSISFDPITKLLNRRTLETRLDEEMARAKRHERELALVMIEIDNFFQYKTTYGEKQGNLALQFLAEILSSNRRREDVTARYEEGKFLIVLPETNEQGTRRVADRVIEKVKSTRLSKYAGIEREQDKTYTSKRGYQELAVSIGIAKYHKEIDTPQTFIKLAESAMMDARKSGTNRITFYRT